MTEWGVFCGSLERIDPVNVTPCVGFGICSFRWDYTKAQSLICPEAEF